MGTVCTHLTRLTVKIEQKSEINAFLHWEKCGKNCIMTKMFEPIKNFGLNVRESEVQMVDAHQGTVSTEY